MKCVVTISLLMHSLIAFAQLEKKLDSVITSSVQINEPGLALYVERDGHVIYKKGFGRTDTETGSAINSKTNFRLASVSKQFTAMCILLLEKDQKLSLDDPLSKFFPELPEQISSKILLRQLITHTSGIIDYENIMNNEEQTQLLDNDVLNLLKTQKITYFEPGSRFRYSNSAYALLALVVERVSGNSFPRFVKERIFDPLGMKNSRVYEHGLKIPNRSIGFAKNKDMKLYRNDQSSTSAVKGDGGVYCSLNDYKKWTHALWKNTLVDMPSAFSRIKYPVKEVNNAYYGPGWFYFNRDYQAWFHSGSTCGFSTFSINIPEKKTSIVYFSNIAGNSETFKRILNVLEEEGITNPSEIFNLHQLSR